jgi:toxin ParE1/3/4
VGSFRLSARARAQVHEIYDYSAATFGSYQADAYHAGLERTSGLLADFPRIGEFAKKRQLA